MNLLVIPLFLLVTLDLPGPGVFSHEGHEGEKVHAENVKQFMDQFGENASVTYNQIKEFFDGLQQEKKRFDNYPRLFSVCASAEHATTRTRNDEHLQRFALVLQELEAVPRKFYQFNASRDSFADGYNKEWIDSMTVSRINTPEADMVNLRQWMHIKVTVANNAGIKGLYLQSVVGPLGLPFGEFSVEFPCTDDKESQNIDVVGQIAPCSYRPRAAITHPGVYVGIGENNSTVNQFHTHFKWSDITCLETPYLQFIVIAVKEFVEEPEIDVHFKPLLSPVFRNLEFDSRDGAAYPYYLTMRDNMYCFLDKAAFDIAYEGAIIRIQPNEDYDACTIGLKTEDRDEDRLECPPGPFQCDESYKDFSANQVQEHREQELKDEETNENCFPCAAPACGPELGFPIHVCKGKSPVTVNNTNLLDTLATASGGKNHAGLAILGFLVLVPLSNFAGRFYKEVGTNFLCGNGPWIFIHSGLHTVSLLVMWLSLGPVAPALGEHASVLDQCRLLKDSEEKALDCAWRQSATNPHVVMGILAFILQNFIVLFGFFRASNNAVRFIQVVLHSHVGYLTFLLGGISSLIAAAKNPCGDSMVFNVLLFIIPFFATGAGVALDFMTDKRVGIRPGRKQWPILEPIKIEGKAPFTAIKWIVFFALAGLMGVLWFIAFVNYTYTSAGDTSILEGKDYINATILADYEPSTIFGKCNTKIF